MQYGLGCEVRPAFLLYGFQRLGNLLFPMADADLDAELLVDMLCQMLGGIDGAVLTTRTSEAEHQRGEATLDIAAHVGIGQFIDRVKERQDFAVVLQEADDWLVESRQLLVRFIASGVVRGTAVEDIAATIA